MLIDWVSLKCSSKYFEEEVLRAYQATQDRLLKIAGDGSIVWEVATWESVRSDSHQVAFQVTNDYIRIQGSPARIINDGDNVFSSGAASALDLVGCFHRFINFVSQHTKIPLPSNPEYWVVTRVDVTCNLHLGSLPAVRQALSILRGCEGGRYRVSQTAGDTVYWSKNSRLRKAKAYAKGEELLHKMRMLGKTQIDQPITRFYTPEEIHLAKGLLRLELTLGSQFWRRLKTNHSLHWYDIKPDFLMNEWKTYFNRMIGGADMAISENIYDRILKIVDLDSKGKPKTTQAKAAYSLWNLIVTNGWQAARDMTADRTWYRNIALLRKAGLSDADLSTGKIVQLRQKVIEAQPVHSWAELKLVANF